MARLTVVRHAKSDHPLGVSDHDRPLSARGVKDAPAIGVWLDSHLTWVDAPPLVLVSSAVRTQQTWLGAMQSLSSRWGSSQVVTEPQAYEASTGTLLELAGQSDDVIIVAHNPGLQDVVSWAREGSMRNEATSYFPTSAIAVLAAEDRSSWVRRDYECTDYVVARG